MERHFYVRDRRVEVEEIDGVVALRSRADASEMEAAAVAGLGEPAAARVGEVVDSEVLSAFHRAGWTFVRPDETTRASIARSETPEHVEATGTVVVLPGGEAIGILTRFLNVQLDSGLTETEADAVLTDCNLEVVRRLNFGKNLYETVAVGWQDAIAASVELHDDSRFVFAEPALIEHMAGRAIPADPDFGEQWQWSNAGEKSGTVGADVGAAGAWDYTHGEGIRVAVIDNGFDAQHEDFKGGVSRHSGYFDGGGSFRQGTKGMPSQSHGTFCAGLVGARRNNQRGGVGAAPDCEIMMIACLADQVGSQATLARSIAYAVDPRSEVPDAQPSDGADIVVCSLGPSGAVWGLTATLELALNSTPSGRLGKGVTVFWAASNSYNVDVTKDEVVSHGNVVAVVRSNRNDVEDNAARGEKVELIAPGVDVFGAKSGNQYGTGTGTSYAAPCAAGCAALALAVNTRLTGEQLRDVMRVSADKVGGVKYDDDGHNADYGFGRVNALKAVLLSKSGSRKRRST